MAINQWFNGTIDPAMAKKADNIDHRHTVSASSTVAAGDFSFAIDTAKVTSLSQFDSIYAGVRRMVAGFLPK